MKRKNDPQIWPWYWPKGRTACLAKRVRREKVVLKSCLNLRRYRNLISQQKRNAPLTWNVPLTLNTAVYNGKSAQTVVLIFGFKKHLILPAPTATVVAAAIIIIIIIISVAVLLMF